MHDNSLVSGDVALPQPMEEGGKEIIVHCHSECTNLKFDDDIVVGTMLAGEEISVPIRSSDNTTVSWINYDHGMEFDEIGASEIEDGRTWHLYYGFGLFEE